MSEFLAAGSEDAVPPVKKTLRVSLELGLSGERRSERLSSIGSHRYERSIKNLRATYLLTSVMMSLIFARIIELSDAVTYVHSEASTRKSLPSISTRLMNYNQPT
jgi:hypothetical protein